MNIWPLKKRHARHPAADQRDLELQRTHQALALFESMCTQAERDAYMRELYRQGYQGGSVFVGVMWSACMKAAPEKLAQAKRMASARLAA